MSEGTSYVNWLARGRTGLCVLIAIGLLACPGLLLCGGSQEWSPAHDIRLEISSTSGWAEVHFADLTWLDMGTEVREGADATDLFTLAHTQGVVVTQRPHDEEPVVVAFTGQLLGIAGDAVDLTVKKRSRGDLTVRVLRHIGDYEVLVAEIKLESGDDPANQIVERGYALPAASLLTFLDHGNLALRLVITELAPCWYQDPGDPHVMRVKARVKVENDSIVAAQDVAVILEAWCTCQDVAALSPTQQLGALAPGESVEAVLDLEACHGAACDPDSEFPIRVRARTYRAGKEWDQIGVTTFLAQTAGECWDPGTLDITDPVVVVDPPNQDAGENGDDQPSISIDLGAGLAPDDIIGVAIAKSDDHVYAWYADGTVSSGSATDLDLYRDRYPYQCPPGKTPADIVALALAPDPDTVVAWYRDGTVSKGSSADLDRYMSPTQFWLPAGKSASQIVAVAITEREAIYAVYEDGAASSGTIVNLGAYDQNTRLLPPSGVSVEDLVGIACSANDTFRFWDDRGFMYSFPGFPEHFHSSGSDYSPPSVYSLPPGPALPWRTTSPDRLDGGIFVIAEKETGKCLDVYQRSTSSGGNVVLWAVHGQPNQQWRFEAVGGGRYRIVSTWSGLCLEADRTSAGNGSNVRQYEYTGGEHQHWVVEERIVPVPAAPSYYWIRSASTQMCLEASDFGTSTITNAQLGDCASNMLTLWELRPADDS